MELSFKDGALVVMELLVDLNESIAEKLLFIKVVGRERDKCKMAAMILKR